MCAFGVGGWHPVGSYSHDTWSGIYALTPGIWSLGVPAGMSTRIVPGAWWDGRGTPTCCFFSDQMCFPPPSWQIGGFPAAWCPSAEPPQGEGAHKQWTLTFLALRIRCPSDDISMALCRREGGSLPASKPQLVKKPSTLGKRSCKLQLAPQLRHVWSADLFLSGGQKWGRLLLSKGQQGDGCKYRCLWSVIVHIAQMLN